MDAETRRRQIEQHLEAIRSLEAQPVVEDGAAWPPKQFYLLWHVVIGMTLGGIGALVSLGANIIGAPLFGEEPLRLIRVYLTFPMGEQALTAEQGHVLSIGCLLYLLTGAFYGVIFHLVMSIRFADASRMQRFIVGSVMGLLLWVVNFYLVLSWLQPMLLGGNWIVSMVPVWVGGLTHLAFAWTMLVGELWVRFEPNSGRAV
jgi:hypothetical protein